MLKKVIITAGLSVFILFIGFYSGIVLNRNGTVGSMSGAVQKIIATLNAQRIDFSAFKYQAATKTNEERQYFDFDSVLITGQTISIKNYSAKNHNFKIYNPEGQHLFYHNIDELFKEIDSLPPAYAGEPAYEKVFRFVVKKHTHDYPFTERAWIHDPLIFYNSLDYGFCDDASQMFAQLCTLYGYKTKVWDMTQRHVTAEVVDNGISKMYDPDYGIYFSNQPGKTCSIKELNENISLFSKENTKGKPAFPNFSIESYVTLYEDPNIVSTLIPGQIDFSRTLDFNLPAEAQIDFPVYLKENLSTFLGKKIPLLQLTLPAGFNGTVKNDLILYAAQGFGDFGSGGSSMSVKPEPLMRRITFLESQIDEITINSDKEVKLFYLLSIKFANLEKLNIKSLALTSSASDSINVIVH